MQYGKFRRYVVIKKGDRDIFCLVSFSYDLTVFIDSRCLPVDADAKSKGE